MYFLAFSSPPTSTFFLSFHVKPCVLEKTILHCFQSLCHIKQWHCQLCRIISSIICITGLWGKKSMVLPLALACVKDCKNIAFQMLTNSNLLQEKDGNMKLNCKLYQGQKQQFTANMKSNLPKHLQSCQQKMAKDREWCSSSSVCQLQPGSQSLFFSK